jgi:cell division protein FtsZ
VDFADVRTVMSEMGMAMMGTGSARGDDRAVAAAEAAVNNPLLEDVNLSGACGILVNVTAGANLTMREFNEIGDVVHQFASEDATVVIGTALDPELQDEVRVTVVATGLNRNAVRHVARREQPAVVARPQIVARTGTDDLPSDYLDSRAPATPAARAVAGPAKARETQSDWLDIPAFLRKQAD